MMKLYAPKDDVRAQKVLVVGSFLDMKIDCPPFHMGKDDQKPEFKRMSPLCRVPLLETCDGPIFESNAIIRYLARSRPDRHLYGKTLHENGEVDMYLDYITYEIEIPMCCLVQDKAKDKAMKDIQTAFHPLDKKFHGKTYLVGETITIADTNLAILLSHGFKSGKLDIDCFFKQFPNTKRWYETIINQKAFKKIIGEGKTTSTTNSSSSKKEKSSQAKEKEEDYLDDEDKPKKEKKPNPLDSLEPTSLDLDSWKREYSNTKGSFEKTLLWFWSHYDPKGWSFWYMKYDKLPGECKVNYVTSNQLNGFLQRLEGSFRKYSFGVINVMTSKNKENEKEKEKEDEGFEIQGVWLLRGKELPMEIKEHPSYEYHQFIHLDETKPEDKQMIEDYFTASEKIGDQKIESCVVWK